MGGKHKKELRSEKAKVKLKGAKLPKGLNVTKTEFKVKKILIRDQLIQGATEDGKRKISVKETLGRLKNHNTGVRMEALRTLKECLVTHVDQAIQNLGNFIQTVVALCLDVESETRKESFKVMNSLLSLVPADVVSPFFHIISSYLRCAMTHIQPPIQEDSLSLLDVILTHLPQMVLSNSENIFSNFLDMISNQRTDAKPGRTLNLKLGSAITTVQWRSKVLLRLRGMLKTVVDHRKPLFGDGNSANIDSRYVVNQPQHFSLLRGGLINNNNLTLFNKTTTVGGVPKGDDVDVARGYIEQLMPLLLDSWLEVTPRSAGEKSSNQIVLSTDAAQILQIVLEIIDLLWSLADATDREIPGSDLKLWFQDLFASQFTNHFLKLFPYQQHGSSEKKKPKKSELNLINCGDQFCTVQNLGISILYCNFCSANVEEATEFNKIVLNFVHKILSKPQSITSENFVFLEKNLRVILFTKGKLFVTANADKTKELLRITISNLQNDMFPKDCRSRIITLLCDIILSSDLNESYGCDEFSELLPTLPQLLLKPTISHHIILTLSKLGKQKNDLFLQSLAENVVPVISNIQAIQAVGSKNQFEGKKLIMNLFYWIESFTPEQRSSLLKTIDDVAMRDQRISAYFKDIITSNPNCV